MAFTCLFTCFSRHALRKDINLKAINAQINRPAIPGRPLLYQPVTYKAQQPANSREIREISIVKATNYIGYSVASKVQGRVYLGKIISHAEKLDYNNNECIVWTAVFRGEEEYDEDKQQSSNPFPRYEDFTYHRMKQANALWREQCRLMKTGEKIVQD